MMNLIFTSLTKNKNAFMRIHSKIKCMQKIIFFTRDLLEIRTVLKISLASDYLNVN